MQRFSASYYWILYLELTFCCLLLSNDKYTQLLSTGFHTRVITEIVKKQNFVIQPSKNHNFFFA